MFINAVNNLPPIPIQVDNTSHCFLIDRMVEQALVDSFPCKAKCKKQSYITDETFGLIKKLISAKRNLFKSFSRIYRSPLWAVFSIWSNQCWRCRWDPIYGFSSSKNLSNWSKQRRYVFNFSNHIKYILRDESKTFFNNLCDNVVEAFNSNDQK